MTAERKSRAKPARPMKLLRAIFAAQQEALEVPAATTTRKLERGVEETTSYPSSEDTLRVSGALLRRHGIMATPLATKIRPGEGGKNLMQVKVSLLHVESGQEQVRVFDVEVSSPWGSNAAATSCYATALRLVLGLPRAPDRVAVVAPESPPEEPRATERVVIPPPRLAERVAERLPPQPADERAEATDILIDTGDREELQRLCYRLTVELGEREGARDPESYRIAAGVPSHGRLDDASLRKYARYLRRQLYPPPEDSGYAWPSEARAQ